MLRNLFLRNSATGVDKNLCFTNAAIQILRNVSSFKEKCIENKQFNRIHGDLFKILEYEGKNQSISAHLLRKSIGEIYGNEWYNGQQNDALEFCEYILQNLHPSILNIFKFKTNTEKNFLVNSNCQHCGTKPTDKNDEHIVLKLSFPRHHHLFKDGIDLQYLINERFSEIETDQANGMRCEVCCSHDESIDHNKKCKPKPFVTQEQLTKHPQYLIVQLLRFQPTESGIIKIENKILNAKTITIQQTEYELISVLNHEGNYQNGHYTALLKSNEWYLCDDINKKVLADNEVESNKNYAYIFKKKVSFVEQEQQEFVLTDEWQYVPPGVHLPGMFEVKMDLATGLNMARLLRKDNDNHKHQNKKSKGENDTNASSVPKTDTNTGGIKQKTSKEGSNLNRTSKNFTDSCLNANMPIPVDILDLASDILKGVFHKMNIHGSIPPSTVLEYLKLKVPLPTSLTIPENCNGINLHLLENKGNIHYVVSQKHFIDNIAKVKIYDSLPVGKKMWVQRLKDLPDQLELIYGYSPQTVDKIEVICAQSQGYYTHTKNSSGLYALANFIMISNGQDPCRFKLLRDMRGQLSKMFVGNNFNIIPFNAEPVEAKKNDLLSSHCPQKNNKKP